MKSLIFVLLSLAACTNKDSGCAAAACTNGFEIVITPDADAVFAFGDYVLDLNVAGAPRVVHCSLNDASPRCDANDVVPALGPAGVVQIAVHLPVVSSVAVTIRAACSSRVVGEQSFTPQYQTVDNGCGGKCTTAIGAMTVRTGPTVPLCGDAGVTDGALDAGETSTDAASLDSSTDAADTSSD